MFERIQKLQRNWSLHVSGGKRVEIGLLELEGSLGSGARGRTRPDYGLLFGLCWCRAYGAVLRFLHSSLFASVFWKENSELKKFGDFDFDFDFVSQSYKLKWAEQVQLWELLRFMTVVVEASNCLEFRRQVNCRRFPVPSSLWTILFCDVTTT